MESEIPKISFSGASVRFSRLFLRIEKPKPNPKSTHFYLGTPFPTLFMPTYSLESTAVAAPQRPVRLILRVSRNPKVVPPIVKPVAVAVVGLHPIAEGETKNFAVHTNCGIPTIALRVPRRVPLVRSRIAHHLCAAIRS